MTPSAYPSHIHPDPRPGVKGGKFVLVTCQNCGKEFRISECAATSQARQSGKYPRFCSFRCRGAWDRGAHR